MTALNMNNGKVLYRMPAHNGQRVTAMQVDVNNSNLLTSGSSKYNFIAIFNLYQ